MRTRDEPGLEGTRRQVHTGVEHGVEEPAEGGGVLGASIVIGAHGVLAEEDREHRAGPLHRVRHTLGGEGGRGGIRDHGRRGLEARVEIFGAAPQGGQPGRRGHRVSRERSGLVDRSFRCQVGHDVGPSTERGCGKAAAHDLAEGEQVRGTRCGHTLEAEPARTGAAEASHHLVRDEQRAVRGGHSAQRVGEADDRRDDSHVAGRCLGDDSRNLSTPRREDHLQRRNVVVGQHDRLGGHVGRDARRVGQGEGRDAGSGGSQQGVDVPVVAAGELHDDVPPGEATGQPDRRHRRLGPAGDQSHLLDRRDPGNDLLGEEHLALAGRPEGEALCRSMIHGIKDVGVPVTEDHRSPGAEQVHQPVAVDVDEPRAVC